MRGYRVKLVGLVVALLAVSGLMVIGTAGAASAKIDSKKPPVRFAMISLKVPGADVLTTYDAGARAAAKVLNARGGFGGRRIVIETCNSQLQAAVATTCAQKTISANPVAMFGCEPNWITGALKIYKAKGIPSFNCSNSDADFKEPSNFALAGSLRGQQRAVARWLCSRSDVKKVVMFTQDIPGQRKDADTNLLPLKNCGKSYEVVGYPLTGADLTPFVNRAVQSKPDFVMTLGGGALVVNIIKLFAQSGIPASKISVSSNALDWTQALSPGGSALSGIYAAVDVKGWGTTSDPEVQAYKKAMQGSSVDYRSGANLGYMPMMFFYEAAKKIGFDKFNAKTLTAFMNSKKNNGLHIPLSRTLNNTGTKASPQIRQPYSQIVQWKGGKLTPVKTGPKKDGWTNGF